MKSFHFNMGNSSTGEIGFCARVKAETKKKAVQLLKDALEQLSDGHKVWDDKSDDPQELPDGVQYVRVYFNPDAVKARCIDESDELCPDCEEEADDVESTFCGSMCGACREKHAKECEVCKTDFAERGS